jgi:hypothetical protein
MNNETQKVIVKEDSEIEVLSSIGDTVEVTVMIEPSPQEAENNTNTKLSLRLSSADDKQLEHAQKESAPEQWIEINEGDELEVLLKK